VKNGSFRGAMKDVIHTRFRKGVGPRHIDFHPKKIDILYVMHELSGTVSVVKLFTEQTPDGHTKITRSEEIQEISSLKEGLTCQRGGHLGGSDIHISTDGKFLYTLNRTDDTVSIFEVNQETGLLSLKSHVPTLGKISRNFLIIPEADKELFVIVNQESKNVVVYTRNTQNGDLSAPVVNSVDIWPTCICPLH
jgi:6-phosphogluconolactonase